MYIIYERDVGAKLCYPQGDTMVFHSYELAMNRAVIISANNSGFAFSVIPLLRDGTQYLRKWALEHDGITLRKTVN